VAERLSFTITPDLDLKVVESSLKAMEKVFEGAGKRIQRQMNEALKYEGPDQVIEFKFQVKNIKDELNVIKRKVREAVSFSEKYKEAVDALRGPLGKTTNELKKQLSYLKELKDNTERFSFATGETTKAWKGVTDRIEKVRGELDRINGESQQFPLIEKLTIANLLANALQGAFNKLAGSIKYVIDTGIQFEQIQLGLEGFIGSASEADEAMQSFIKTAVESPLNVEQVAEGAKTLLAFGLTADETKESVDRLAKIAGATGSDLKLLARNLGQVKSQGRAFTRDLNQFGTAGVPIFRELANVIGVTEAEIRKMATDGVIGFEAVNQAIINMTQSGSAFDNIAKRMQNTWGGQIEAMVSAIQLFSAELLKTITDIDNVFFGVLQKSLKLAVLGIKGLASALKNLKPVIAVLAGAVTGYAAAWAAVNFKVIIGALIALKATLWGTVKATWAAIAAKLGLATAMNPAVGIAYAAAVAGVVVAVGGLAREAMAGSEEVQDLQEQLDKKPNAEQTFEQITLKLAKLSKKAKELREEFERLGGLDKKQQGPKPVTGEQERLAVAKEIRAVEQDRLDILNMLEEKYGKATRTFIEQAVAQKTSNLELLDIVGQYGEKIAENEGRWEALTKQAEAHKEAVNKVYGDAIKAREKLIQQITEQGRAEQKLARETREALVKKYEGQRKQLDAIYSQILRNIDAEIGALSKRGPKEQELYDLNKKELQEKIKKGDLNDKELLQLEAQLERMERQEKIEKLQEARQRVELEQEQRMNQLKKEEEATLKRLDDKEKAREKRREQHIEKLKSENKNLEAQQGKKIAALDKILNREKIQYKNQKDMDRQLALVQDKYDVIQKDTLRLAENLERAETAAEGINRVSDGLVKAAQAAAVLKPDTASYTDRSDENFAAGAAMGIRAAGGPVSGGSAYQVNELGKEAFLSAAGRLSMINAPAYGKWRAPSSGTVIPAHLTKQLDIPQGGVNLNGQPNFDQRKAGRNPLNRILSALSGAGSDNIQNNVTVQSANPTKTASDMLVQLTKLRRRRMY
jgi:tape measure domain-containing protein